MELQLTGTTLILNLLHYELATCHSFENFIFKGFVNRQKAAIFKRIR